MTAAGHAAAGIVTGLTTEARIARGLGLPLAGGGTGSGAACAAAELLRRGATCLVSFGLAGGLDPRLGAGAVVVPRTVTEEGEVFEADPDLTARLGGATHDAIIVTPSILSTVAEKRAARERSGAAAVDLESAAVARAARAAGVPFAVFRAVCDPAAFALPPAALLALDAHGGIAMVRVLRSLAVSPGQLPALLTLARAAARARAALVRGVRDIQGRGGLVG